MTRYSPGWRAAVAELFNPHARADLVRRAASNYADKPWSKAGREEHWPELLEALHPGITSEEGYDVKDPYTVGWETGAGEMLEWLKRWRFEHPRDVSAEAVKALEKIVDRGCDR